MADLQNIFDPQDRELGGGNNSGGFMGIGFLNDAPVLNAISYRKKQAALDKAASGIYQAMQPEPDPVTGETKPNPLGDPDTFSSMSRQDRIGKVGGFIKGSVLKEAMADAQARQQEVAAQAQLNQQRTKDDQVSGSLLSNAMADDNFKTDPVGSVQRSAKALAASGVPMDALSRSFPRALDNLVKLQGVMSDANGTPAKDTFFKSSDLGQEIPGLPGVIRVPTGPNTSELRDKNGGLVVPQRDTNGSLIGYSIPDGKGGMRFTAAKSAGLTPQDYLKSYDEQEKSIRGDYNIDPAAKAEALAKIGTARQSLLDNGKSANPAANGSAAAAAQIPKPTPADIQYLRANPTSAMTAKFNGRFGDGAADNYLP